MDYHEVKDKELFNSIATTYFRKDIYPVSSYARKFQLLSLFELLPDQKNKKLDAILELGCGVGASASYLKGLYEHYTGIDYSEAFVNIARNHFSDNKTNFLCLNLKDYKKEPEKIDFVFGVGVLHHVSELDNVLKAINKIGDNETLFGFIEPQSGNPLIQLMRKIRIMVDKNYSGDQFFFKKETIEQIFNKNEFEIIKIKYQGYFTPPFAQVILKPQFIFMPMVKFLIQMDKLIQNHLNNMFSWNIMWIARKSNRKQP